MRTVDDCPDAKKLHTPCPRSYLGWHDWAATKARTHRQKKCPTCGYYAIWVPKVKEHPFDAKLQQSDGWLCPRCLKTHPTQPERCDSCEALGYE